MIISSFPTDLKKGLSSHIPLPSFSLVTELNRLSSVFNHRPGIQTASVPSPRFCPGFIEVKNHTTSAFDVCLLVLSRFDFHASIFFRSKLQAGLESFGGETDGENPKHSERPDLAERL